MYVFGIPFLLALIYSLLTGRAYFAGPVTRSDQPVRYWLSVCACAGCAWILFALGPVR